jgi:hypothetical protein
MEKNKLVPMVEFILSHPASTDYEWQLKNHLNYANFLSQPLELWMFVPVGDNGEVLEEPTNLQKMQAGWADNPLDANFYNVCAYNEAKQRCLFEGFEMHDLRDGVKRLTSPCGHFNPYWYSPVRRWYPARGIENQTVEDLVRVDVTLTETALKQIYG